MRPPKDLVELVAERTHRHIIRILHNYSPLRAMEIERRLEEFAKIRFKSTSSLTETLQRLQGKELLNRKDSYYSLTKLANERWIVKFLNLLVRERIDRGSIIKGR